MWKLEIGNLKYGKWNMKCQNEIWEMRFGEVKLQGWKFGNWKLENWKLEIWTSPTPLNIPTPTPAPDNLLGGHNELGGTSIEWAWGSYPFFVAQKLRRIILLLIGVVAFNCDFPKITKGTFHDVRTQWTCLWHSKPTIRELRLCIITQNNSSQIQIFAFSK